MDSNIQNYLVLDEADSIYGDLDSLVSGILRSYAAGTLTSSPVDVGGTILSFQFEKVLETMNLFPVLKERKAITEEQKHTLGVEGDDLSVTYDTSATIRFVESKAGYKNTLGYYTVGEDGTIKGTDIAFENIKKLKAGAEHTIDLPGSPDEDFGFFIIADGYKKNKNFKDIDLEKGTVDFVYDYGGKNERAARITDDAEDISLVFSDGKQVTVLKGDVYHTTLRGDGAALNEDDAIHAVSGLAEEGNFNTLRIGFEDLKNLGDADFNDVIFDLEVSGKSLLTILGSEFGETLSGTADIDIILADGGDDTVIGSAGADIIDGGLGVDWLDYESMTHGVEALLYGEETDGTRDIITNIENVKGSNFADFLSGTNGDNIMMGLDGDDRLSGNIGNDTIYGGEGRDELIGGYGDDYLHGEAGNDLLYGLDGNDVLSGGGGADKLYGDLVTGAESFTGDDEMSGGDGDDFLYGHGGQDVLYGDNGFDQLFGGGGDDILYGGSDNDRLLGGGDNDTLYGGAGDDFLNGEDGNDTVSYADAIAAVSVLLNARQAADDTGGLDTLRNIENARGGAFNDTLTGDANANILEGLDGNDNLRGNEGADTLIGGNGADTLYGGGDIDTFGFTGDDGVADLIGDFDLGGGEVLNITDLLTGFEQGVSDITDFVSVRFWGANRSDIKINEDGQGTDFNTAIVVYGSDFSGLDAQDLLDNGTLVVDQSLVL